MTVVAQNKGTHGRWCGGGRGGLLLSLCRSCPSVETATVHEPFCNSRAAVRAPGRAPSPAAPVLCFCRHLFPDAHSHRSPLSAGVESLSGFWRLGEDAERTFTAKYARDRVLRKLIHRRIRRPAPTADLSPPLMARGTPALAGSEARAQAPEKAPSPARLRRLAGAKAGAASGECAAKKARKDSTHNVTLSRLLTKVTRHEAA